MTPLSILPSDISALGQERGVTFIRKLLWAEAVKCNAGQKSLSVPGCINTADGGIDASIRHSESTDDRLIPKGLVGYQIKTGTTRYSPEDCKKEMHVDHKINNDLKPGVKKILDEGGIYFLILLQDITTEKEEDRLNPLKDHVEKLGYKRDQVRLMTPNSLANITEEHLSVVVWLKQVALDFIPFDAWEQELDNDVEFLFDETRRKICTEISAYIREPQDKARMIRITGLPGIGKTRFVNQLLIPDDFRNRVIFGS